MKGKASPFGFVLHPRTLEKLKLTLLTHFSLDALSRAPVTTLGEILCGYLEAGLSVVKTVCRKSRN
jgi:hypothetical protein